MDCFHPIPIRSTRSRGTKDKLLIDGHYYSDKPMIPAVLNAAAYRLLMFVGLPRPDDRPDVFTLRLDDPSLRHRLCRRGRLHVAIGQTSWAEPGLAAHLAGWPAGDDEFAREPTHDNSMPGLPQLGDSGTGAPAGTDRKRKQFAMGPGRGRLARGLASPSIRLPVRRLLGLATLVIVIRMRRVRSVGLYLAGAPPWVVAHEWVNYSIGHVWVPLNMVPEYLEWPGSPF